MSNATAAFSAIVEASDDDTVFDKIGEMSNVRLEISGEVIDATSFDTVGWRDRIRSLNDWSWSGSAFYLEGDTAQDRVRNALTGQTKMFIRIRPKGSTTGNLEFRGPSMVTGYNLEGAVDGAFAVDLEGVGAGALVIQAQP